MEGISQLLSRFPFFIVQYLRLYNSCALRGREREDLEGVRNRFLVCTMRTLSRGPVCNFARGEFASGSKWGMTLHGAWRGEASDSEHG